MEIHTIDLEFQGLPGVIACFLVEGEGALVLVECGPMSSLSKLQEGIAAAGFTVEEVSDVLLTHIHLDHAGSAGWWAGQGARVHVHERGVAHLIDPSRLWQSVSMVYGDKTEELWGSLPAAEAGQVCSVVDGEEIIAGDLPFRALDTPGHAAHHLSYAIEGDEGREIFVGDVAGARLNRSSGGTKDSGFTTVTSAAPQFDPPAYLRSIDLLLEQSAEVIHLTHYAEVRGAVEVKEHLEKYRVLVEEASELARQLVERGLEQSEAVAQWQAAVWERAALFNLNEKAEHAYRRCNPSKICAEGALLYWQKKLKQS